jgi:hypothetical protein
MPTKYYILKYNLIQQRYDFYIIIAQKQFILFFMMITLDNVYLSRVI